MDEGRIPGAKDVWGIEMAGTGMAEIFLDSCRVSCDVLLSVPGRVIMTGVGGVLCSPCGSSYQCIIRGSLFCVDTGFDCGDGEVIDDSRGAGAGADDGTGAGAGVGDD